MKALKKLHEAAAEHYEKAAEHHRNAAEHASDGEHLLVAQQAHVAHGHALHGHDLAAQASKRHIDVHAEHESEEEEAA